MGFRGDGFRRDLTTIRILRCDLAGSRSRHPTSAIAQDSSLGSVDGNLPRSPIPAPTFFIGLWQKLQSVATRISRTTTSCPNPSRIHKEPDCRRPEGLIRGGQLTVNGRTMAEHFTWIFSENTHAARVAEADLLSFATVFDAAVNSALIP
jgi:hypothetical protein